MINLTEYRKCHRIMTDKIPLTESNYDSNNLNSPTSTNYELQKIEPIRKQLEEVKKITVDNIDKVLERGERIEVLVDSSERLQTSSLKFQRNARNLKRAMCYRKAKCYILSSGMCLLFIYILAWSICGNATLKHCH